MWSHTTPHAITLRHALMNTNSLVCPESQGSMCIGRSLCCYIIILECMCVCRWPRMHSLSKRLYCLNTQTNQRVNVQVHHRLHHRHNMGHHCVTSSPLCAHMHMAKKPSSIKGAVLGDDLNATAHHCSACIVEPSTEINVTLHMSRWSRTCLA